MEGEEEAVAVQICSLCSFGEHGQTKRGIDLNAIACDRGSILSEKEDQKKFHLRNLEQWTWMETDYGRI